jgi:hypothetical protein
MTTTEAIQSLYQEASKGKLTEAEIRATVARETDGLKADAVVALAVAVLGSTPSRTRRRAFDAIIDRISRRAAMVRRCAVIDSI